MNNFPDNMLEAYLFETNALLERLDELLLSAEQTNDFTTDDVNEIFRSMHTIKGSSAMMEFKPLTEVAHHVEDLFFYIRENGMELMSQELKSDLFNLLFKCTDRLREDTEKVEQGVELAANVEDFIEMIDNFLTKIRSENGAPASKPQTVEKKEEPTPQITENTQAVNINSQVEGDLPPVDKPYILHILFDEDCGMENLRALIVVNSTKDLGIDFNFYPEDIETNSETSEYIISSGFYMGFTSEEETEKVLTLLPALNNIRSFEVLINPKFQDLAEASMSNAAAVSAQKEEVKPEVKLDKPKSEEIAKVPQQNNDMSNKLKNLNQTKQSLISVNLSKLDKLMAVVGEIVITQSMVAAAPELQGLKLDNFYKSTRQLRKLTDDLQDIAMSLRMVSVSGVFQKMNRIVRDMTKSLNKDVKLTIIGEDTEVDKTIVDSIQDPIMHIVRNAMDHGIEDNEDERLEAGKPAQGEIILSAEHTGSDVIIKIANDGKDFNLDAIVSKAARKGLLTKPQEEYSKKEILALLMLPGFSTNSQVTEYSGRGVGLDVVKRNVESIGGTVTITNDPGEYCAFTLKIPLTLAIVEGMEISVAGNTYTIPISNIKQSFKAKTEDVLFDTSGNEIISCMGEFYPIIRLGELFRLGDNYITNIEDGILIWIDAFEKSFCLFVDELIGEQQVVVKPLPSYLNNFKVNQYGITGCTILGDGNISIILDVGNVYNAGIKELKGK